MSAVDDVDELSEQFHLAQGEFVKGNPEPVKKLLSRRDDATLNYPTRSRAWVGTGFCDYGACRIAVQRGRVH